MGIGKALFGLLKRIIGGIVTGIINNPGASMVFIYAFIAGVAASNTWIGDWVGTIIGWFPAWVAVVGFVLLFIAVLWDLANEGVPEAFAIYGALFLPSIALSIPEDARLHAVLTTWITDLNNWLDRQVGEWLAPGAQEFTATCIALIGFGLSAMWIHKWGKGRHGTSGATDTTTTTTTSPVRRRRARN